MLSLTTAPSPLVASAAVAMRSAVCEDRKGNQPSERRGSHTIRKPFTSKGYWLSSDQGNKIPATV